MVGSPSRPRCSFSGTPFSFPSPSWVSDMTSPDRTVQLRPSYGAAGVAGALVLALYVATLAPSTAMWDASEYITAAYTLGIPHPPGNPLFVLLGRVASLMP